MTTGDPKQGVYAEGRVLATDAETVTTESLVNAADGQAWETLQAAGYEAGDIVVLESHGMTDDAAGSTTSTTYTDVLESTSPSMLGAAPSSVTLYGRFIANLDNDTSGETTFARPNVQGDGGAIGRTALTELEVSVTGAGSIKADSGWTEITTSLSGPVWVEHIEAKVTGGTGTADSRFGCGLLVGAKI